MKLRRKFDNQIIALFHSGHEDMDGNSRPRLKMEMNEPISIHVSRFFLGAEEFLGMHRDDHKRGDGYKRT